MTDIIELLRDLHKQATTERSHYYVASCVDQAIHEIERLRSALSEERELRAETRDNMKLLLKSNNELLAALRERK